MSITQPASDAIVVGGGVIGCATAYFLGKQYGLHCLVLQRDDIGSNASGNAAGELSPMSQGRLPDDLTRFCVEGVRLHRAMAEELQEDSGLAYSLVDMPVFRPAFDDEEERNAHDLIRWSHGLGIGMQWLQPEAIDWEQSWLDRQIRGATYGRELQLDTPAFAAALARAASKYGAIFHVGEEATSVEAIGAAQVVATKTAQYVTQKVILATGPWTELTTKALGAQIPVKPLRGQIVYLKADRPLPPSAIFHSTGYVLPKPSGLLMVGTTEEDVGFACETTDAARSAILQATKRLAPVTANMAVDRMTACLRPLSADGLPIIGTLPSRPNTYVATGHGRKGIVLSLATGKYLADLIVTGQSTYPLQPFAPARFGEA